MAPAKIFSGWINNLTEYFYWSKNLRRGAENENFSAALFFCFSSALYNNTSAFVIIGHSNNEKDLKNPLVRSVAPKESPILGTYLFREVLFNNQILFGEISRFCFASSPKQIEGNFFS